MLIFALSAQGGLSVSTKVAPPGCHGLAWHEVPLRGLVQPRACKGTPLGVQGDTPGCARDILGCAKDILGCARDILRDGEQGMGFVCSSPDPAQGQPCSDRRSCPEGFPLGWAAKKKKKRKKVRNGQSENSK